MYPQLQSSGWTKRGEERVRELDQLHGGGHDRGGREEGGWGECLDETAYRGLCSR